MTCVYPFDTCFTFGTPGQYTQTQQVTAQAPSIPLAMTGFPVTSTILVAVALVCAGTILTELARRFRRSKCATKQA